LGEGAQAPKEQSDADGLERRTGDLREKVGKHRSGQGSGKALFGLGQSGSGHQHVQELSAVRRGAYAVSPFTFAHRSGGGVHPKANRQYAFLSLDDVSREQVPQ